MNLIPRTPSYTVEYPPCVCWSTTKDEKVLGPRRPLLSDIEGEKSIYY